MPVPGSRGIEANSRKRMPSIRARIIHASKIREVSRELSHPRHIDLPTQQATQVLRTALFLFDQDKDVSVCFYGSSCWKRTNTTLASLPLYHALFLRSISAELHIGARAHCHAPPALGSGETKGVTRSLSGQLGDNGG